METGARKQRTYVVGDIHGRLDLLKSSVAAIEGHAGDSDFKVVFLGDYVDRGPDSRGVIEFLMNLERRFAAVCLGGNHEQIMFQALTSGDARQIEQWIAFGGDATLRSYELGPDRLFRGVPAEHLSWIAGLPRTLTDRHRVYVHAGLRPRVPLDQQTEEDCLWIRERFLRARASDFGAHVVHGHTLAWEGKPDPSQPELLAHRTNLDTGAYATGILCVAVFDDAVAGGPIEVLRVRGEAAIDVGRTPSVEKARLRDLFKKRLFPIPRR